LRNVLGRVSPAMAVAMLALFVALSGTAVATTSALITGRQIKNSSITGLDVKNKSLTPRDFRGSVRGPRGLRGPAGAQGAPGAAGASGAPGSAVAYARINADGTVDEANSKNVADANVTHPEAGVYCFVGLAFAVHAVSVAPDDYGPGEAVLVNPTFHGAPPYDLCGNNPRVRVTTAAAPSTLSDHPFYITFN
jgi:hypothetical protein